ncbi:hypothetical protein [Lapillicoccus jejuensis]|uniref:Uncharacterized protein n=1 Tax=Lapillicoccus jejuensis TaxID=402171 RepID=A0A542E1F9_9MICO|nr:hypothetical protein [Lapillicoccus jejuensis]TQJ09109.1 hypothetical protein FB458_2215 [Lapillicoccus jejuensis]
MPTSPPVHRDRDAVVVSPFEVAVHGQRAPLLRTMADLLRSARRAEAKARLATPGDVVLVSVEHRRFWTRSTREVYESVAARGTTVVVFGVGLPTDLSGALVRRPALVGIGEDDLLADEWLVIICQPHRRWGFVSRLEAAGLPGARSAPRVPPDDSGGDDLARTFLYAELSDPVGLERAAAVLLTRVPQLAVAVPWLSVSA